ncbi:MAG: hypothetical protein D6830_05070 [Ignavibacteria bacterium]|nr:MAG: hypothetical protein D6830_05070 [Ignavibacteria bacterium]
MTSYHVDAINKGKNFLLFRFLQQQYILLFQTYKITGFFRDTIASKTSKTLVICDRSNWTL